jgi:hypothetical protein
VKYFSQVVAGFALCACGVFGAVSSRPQYCGFSLWRFLSIRERSSVVHIGSDYAYPRKRSYRFNGVLDKRGSAEPQRAGRFCLSLIGKL